MCEDPPTIRLNFEPGGRAHLDEKYYLADKANRCCVCGNEGSWLRHSIVPHQYRRHFPMSMKSRISHDIVLLCPACHVACARKVALRVREIGEQYNAPVEQVCACACVYRAYVWHDFRGTIPASLCTITIAPASILRAHHP